MPLDSPIPPRPEKATVLIVHYPGGNTLHPEVAHWIYETRKKAESDPRVERVGIAWINDTPITMTRNRTIRDALRQGVTHLLMVDNDTIPDEKRPGMVPFWESSFDFLWNLDAPACVAAPYVGPPPVNNIFVFKWRNLTNHDWFHKLDQFTRDEAFERAGFEHVPALPTGCLLFDMQLFALTPEQPVRGLPPVPGLGWCYYEWEDAYAAEKASTEDVTLTRDISLWWHDVPNAGCYVNWSSWAEHYKSAKFGAPVAITNEDVGKLYRRAYERPLSRDLKTIMLRREAAPCPAETA